MRDPILPSYSLLLTALLITATLLATPSEASAQAAGDKPFTIFMHVKTTDAFLAMSPGEWLKWVEKDVVPILKDHPGVELRFFDSEFYNAEMSDVLMWTTSDLDAYQSVVERLRETKFWGPYFSIGSIVPARENAFAEFYGSAGSLFDSKADD